MTSAHREDPGGRAPSAGGGPAPVPAPSARHLPPPRQGHALLERIETYYDAVPRSAADAEDFGPLTLFVRRGDGHPYYARPARPRIRAVRAADVDRVRARQRELGIPESFEWVAENAPELRAAAEESGLAVHEHPLMVYESGAEAAGWDERDACAPGSAEAGAADPGAAPAPASSPAHVPVPVPVPVPAPEGVAVRVVGPDDPVLPSALAVPHLAFAEPGTHIGAAGAGELAEAVRRLAADGTVRRTAARITAGLTVVAAALRDGTALSAGQHQPVGTVSEIVGVGTLPSARRRGLGLAVTAALLADARERRVDIVFLSADDADVARLYARLGFRRAATALIAEPAA